MPLSDPNREQAKRRKLDDAGGGGSGSLPPIFQNEPEEALPAPAPMVRLDSADLDSPKPSEAFLRQVFATNPLFKNIKSDEVRLLLRNFHRTAFDAGVAIMREGEHGDRFYVLESGTIGVATRRDGHVQTGTRGYAFGELALIEDKPVRPSAAPRPADGACRAATGTHADRAPGRDSAPPR